MNKFGPVSGCLRVFLLLRLSHMLGVGYMSYSGVYLLYKLIYLLYSEISLTYPHSIISHPA